LDVPAYLKSSGVEYIPMQWGSGNVEGLADKVKAQGAKTLLGFNEPDFEAQSNLDPVFAAELWKKHIEPLKASGVRLGGPAVTSSGTGQPWLTRFFEACSNCTIDFLPLHWYGSGSAGFYDYLYQMHGQFPKYPIWVTEYADTSLNETDVITFLNQTAEFLDKTEWIERYAWFGYFRPENNTAYNFLESDGGLNSLGRAYIGAPTVEKSGPVTSAVPTIGGGGAGDGPTRSLRTISVPTNEPTPTLPPSNAAAFLPPLGGLHALASIIVAAVSLVWTHF